MQREHRVHVDPGGPRPATLTVPTGSTSQTVSLDGTALLGTSSLTTSGADWIDAEKTGVTTTHTSTAVSAETVLTLPAGGRYGFQAGDETAVIASGSTAPLAVGSHAVSADPDSGYLMDVTGWQRGCSDLEGTLNVKGLRDRLRCAAIESEPRVQAPLRE